jgi:hypothetical protein
MEVNVVELALVPSVTNIVTVIASALIEVAKLVILASSVPKEETTPFKIGAILAIIWASCAIVNGEEPIPGAIG